MYSQGGSLWTVRNDGSDRRRLTVYDGSYSDEPAWSPDGSQVAYSRGRREDGNWFSHIYAVNADGTGRTKLSSGDVVDSNPAWSPHGDRIIFERLTWTGRNADGALIDADEHLVVMDATGENRTTLTTGGRWERTPIWSPDGNRIAYFSHGSVWLSDLDGSNAKSVFAGALRNAGLSWSPDGRRIAFGRGDQAESSIVIAEIDGVSEENIAGPTGRNVAPRWSPDGERIAFTNHVDEDTRHIYVSGARGSQAAGATDCRPRGGSGTTAGFPLPAGWAPSTGTLRVAVLFVDFPDAQATHTTEEEAEMGLAYMEQHLEAVSYGQLDIEVVPHHRWLRAEQPHTQYVGTLGVGQGLSRPISEHAVALADDEVDFSEIHAVVTVFPSSHFGGGGNAGGTVSADGSSLRQSRINDALRDEVRELSKNSNWGSTAAHELTHNLGLLDLYPYDDSVHEQPPAPSGQQWTGVEWGLMRLEAWFLAAEHEMLLRVTKHYPSGRRQWVDFSSLDPSEMLAWNRWQLGWLSEDQVRCVNEPNATVTLSPIAQPNAGVAMAAVPLNARKVIVIESRRQLGYDLGDPYFWSDGSSTRGPALIAEGVLVYTVDPIVESGQLPLKIAGDSGNGQVDDFPVLTLGESVTLGGYTITVTGDNDDTHTVTITLDP